MQNTKILSTDPPHHCFSSDKTLQPEGASKNFIHQTDIDLLVNTIDGIIWEADPVTFQIRYVSSQAERILGYPLSVWYQPDFWSKHIHPEDAADVFSFCAATTKKGINHTMEYRMFTACGRIIWFKDVVSVIKENEKVVAARGLLIDITREKEMAQQLKQKDELFKAIVQNSFDAITLLDENRKIKYASPSLFNMLGYTEVELLNRDGLELIDANDQCKAADQFQNLFTSTNPQTAEFHFRHKNGHRVLVETLGKNMMHNPYVHGLLISMRDITEKKRLEQELIKNEVRQQQDINKAILQAQEQEREALAQELHDNINQLISAAKLMVDSAISIPSLQEKLLSNSSEALGKAITEIRSLSSSLVHYDVSELGLCESVLKLVESIRLPNMPQIHTQLNATLEERFDQSAQICLFRIIQEQVNNVLKHAKASELHIELLSKEEKTLLRISDNGIGFDPQQKRKGIGLTNLANRVKILNGHYKFITSKGNGCTLEVLL